MLKKLVASLLLTVSLVLVSTSTATASGLTTSGDSANGQVKTTTQDGVMYLTTETNSDGTVTTTQTQQTYSRQYTFLSGTKINVPEGFALTIGQWISAVMSFIMVIAALLVLLYIMWGAFDWLTSGGDKGKIDQARQKIIAAVIGIVIVASSFAISQLMLQFLGFSSFEDLFSRVDTLNATSTNRSASSSATKATGTSALDSL
jgi:hypothetical protein